MKKTLFLLSAALILCFDSAFGWGKMGHDAIAYIANATLQPKAKKTIEKYIGTSIVHYASWMDAYRFEPQYAHTSLWHTAWVDDNDEYDPTRQARRQCDQGNRGYDGAAARLQVAGRLDGRRQHQVSGASGGRHALPDAGQIPRRQGLQHLRRRRKLNYHGVWDSYVLDCNVRWSGMEFQHILDRCTKREIQGHHRRIGARLVPRLRRLLPANLRAGTADQQFKSPDVWEDFLNPALPIAERQILYAGYRLAHVLNELFG